MVANSIIAAFILTLTIFISFMWIESRKEKRKIEEIKNHIKIQERQKELYNKWSEYK